MKIICISDTHGMLRSVSVPDGDVLIHAGDLTGRGTVDEIQAELRHFAQLPHPKKIFIAGNHDWGFQTKPYVRVEALRLKKFEQHSIHYLQDSGITIDGVKFWGSPWQPEFGNWAFNLPRGKALEEKWAMIPEDTQVLITHGPPHGILDEAPRHLLNYGRYGWEHVGCKDLRRRLADLPDIKLHVFGHIHEGYGQVNMPEKTSGPPRRVFVNASMCDGQYLPVNLPIIYDLK